MKSHKKFELNLNSIGRKENKKKERIKKEKAPTCTWAESL
jgi:hypothetical protein